MKVLHDIVKVLDSLRDKEREFCWIEIEADGSGEIKLSRWGGPDRCLYSFNNVHELQGIITDLLER